MAASRAGTHSHTDTHTRTVTHAHTQVEEAKHAPYKGELLELWKLCKKADRCGASAVSCRREHTGIPAVCLPLDRPHFLQRDPHYSHPYSICYQGFQWHSSPPHSGGASWHTHIPSPPHILHTFKNTFEPPRISAGTVPRLAVEGFLQREVRGLLSQLDAATVLDLLSAHTFGEGTQSTSHIHTVQNTTRTI